MASQSRDFELVRNGHECEKCGEPFQPIDDLRASAERQCPLSRVRLACVKWAITRLSLGGDWYGNNHYGLFHFQAVRVQGSFGVEVFDLDGM